MSTTTSGPRLAGKVAVVTGGADGIGRGITEMLAKHGARVAVFDIRGEAAAATAAELAKQGLDVIAQTVDVTNEESVATAMEAVWNKWGALHVLVNNAGVSGPPQATDEVDLAEWQSMFAVNVQGPFLCTKHAVPYQRRTPGGKSIVNISSIYGLIGNADAPSYHAAKGAVRLMAKTDAVTYAPEGIRVNAVCPGSIMTEFNLRKADEIPGYLDDMIALHPVGHIGEPEDIAYGVLYLASDESRFVTGTELVIDGGYTAQ
ncbi:SDR family NAD(P)-dependent oxidoreductase [Paenarthrobacter sp. NPDC057981]|uniref:SDR family NAD(P)-dependent oxidoreductase n=1 Tax=Paenarthrobacter sp. NPDC057981 TaxID=3346297 RepID=UPI0036D88D26